MLVLYDNLYRESHEDRESGATVEINISYCNNIESARVLISESKLNIKYAPNGTGKSTIAKALQAHSSDDLQALEQLLPFKYRVSNPSNIQPAVTCSESLSKIMCFNEDYVGKFTFRPDELISNSFDIFIRSGEYKRTEQEIDELVREIKQLFVNNPELEELVSNLKELSAAFKLTRSGLSKASTGMKGLSAGNNIEHIPAGLEEYQPFIQSDKSIPWIDWQTKGCKEFAGLSENCPFCSSDSTNVKEKIQQVSNEYDKNVIKNLVGIISIIEKLGEYFSDDARKKLDALTKLKDGLKGEHEAYIVNVKNQIDILIEKLEGLKTISGFHFNDGITVAEKLPSYILDLQFYAELDSIKTREAIASINESIQLLIERSGLLQGRVNIQRQQIEAVVQRHQNDINDFLAYAGYKYQVQIAGDDDSAQLKLLHIDHDQHLSGGAQHLSFGEKNAFAIILFMYECLSKQPDLIVLDDPISSFDKNKKFAILEMLFRRDPSCCLKSKTVLMLTHDVEPIIDTLRSVKPQFHNQVSAAFLRMSVGHITEQEICEEHIKTFAQICSTAISSDRHIVLKLIYLRRNCEILDDRGDAYQILSNLLHLRDVPKDSRVSEEGGHPEMEDIQYRDGCAQVASKISNFEYNLALAELSNMGVLKTLYSDVANGYEKLQVFRLIHKLRGSNDSNSVIKKFFNETYHVENELICQLDPSVFDLIPEYVIKKCDEYIQEE